MAVSPIITFNIPDTGFSFRVRLLVEQNPDVAQQVISQLPLKSVLGHVVIAGETFWTPCRIVHLGDNNMVQRHRGAVFLNSLGQSICLIYGRITESAKINKFGEVLEEDLHKLEPIGKLIYQQTVAQPRRTLMQVHITGDFPLPKPSENYQLPAPACSPEGHWRATKKLIEKEIDRIWLDEPEEIQKIRWGVIDSGAGTGEQYFTVLVHLEAFLMVLGGDLMGRFLKIAQDDDVRLTTLNRITKEFLVERFDLFEFMGDLGLPSMLKIGGMFATALDTLESKQDYIQLMGTMLTYTNRLHRWSYFIFPWHLGVEFPHRKPREILSIADLLRQGCGI
ncbi:hypothetical protein ANOM_000946 [Aspergillus nomiae NRRL 13137]|uniref:Cucumopine synthase C-terminal helical bundle domain-containing protein n=1 Tax=Aspergillus nomiae NRRL (strain ATCC 15546 / NRRL 13137 / CBS 260.88 / M93) TaxID=1509407 RepID=A0A0L1JGF9_ASPN3|nr:uncharacterized protein ANOM_000946 [Aspergillus nomiae NRRL 13137]KNG90865.1 hypothetical protein ANOM_000946 [Aspergillus nomiae NRRL 13137]